MAATSRTLEHVGEWQVEVRADTIEELFAELARVLAEAAGPCRPARATEWESVELEARDLAALAVAWANELIGRGEISGRAYGNVRHLTIESTSSPVRLAADVSGDLVDEWVSPVKAATYHGAVVEQQGREWRGVMLFDV